MENLVRYQTFWYYLCPIWYVVELLITNCTYPLFYTLHKEVLAVFTHEPNFHFPTKVKRKQHSPSPVAAATELVQKVIALQGREPTCAEAKSQLGEQQAGQKDDWGQEIEKIETGRWSHLGLTESRLVAGQSNTERKLSEQEWPEKNEA